MAAAPDFPDEPRPAGVEAPVARSAAIPAAVAAVLAGDTSRFAEIVRAFDAIVRRNVRRILRDAHAAEDAVQEVWIRVFRQLGQLHAARAADAWIGRVARNCALDFHRDRERLLRLRPLGGEPEVTPAAAWLWDMVAAMPTASRDLLTWRYREGRAYAWIAGRLGVPHSTVRGRLHDARQELRRRINLRNKS